MISKDEINDKKRIFKSMLEALKYQFQEIDNQENWFVVQQPGYEVNIKHVPDDEFIYIGYRKTFATFKDDVIKHLSELEDNNIEFRLGLMEALKSPFTSFYMTFDNDNKITGFSVEMRIFVFQDDISIKDIDDAMHKIDSVVIAATIFILRKLGDFEMIQEMNKIIARDPSIAYY